MPWPAAWPACQRSLCRERGGPRGRTLTCEASEKGPGMGWKVGLGAALHRPRSPPPLPPCPPIPGPPPFNHLVYPLPTGSGGLGVHATLDLAGRVRFGPDVQWLPVPSPLAPPPAEPEGGDWTVDPVRAAQFYASVRSWWPGLPDCGLSPAYAGVRPKVRACSRSVRLERAGGRWRPRPRPLPAAQPALTARPPCLMHRWWAPGTRRPISSSPAPRPLGLRAWHACLA